MFARCLLDRVNGVLMFSVRCRAVSYYCCTAVSHMHNANAQ